MPDPRRARRWAILAAGVLFVVGACTSPDVDADSPLTTDATVSVGTATSIGTQTSIEQPTSRAATGTVVSEMRGFPPPSLAPSGAPTEQTSALQEVAIGWAPDDDVLVVTAFGSSSCPQRAWQVSATGGQHLDMTIVEYDPAVPGAANQSCTADSGPTPRSFGRPQASRRAGR